MSVDISKRRFVPRSHYAGVYWEQGRVRLDSEDNETWLIDNRRTRVESIDMKGACWLSMETPERSV